MNSVNQIQEDIMEKILKKQFPDFDDDSLPDYDEQ
jgi:hypothetical protein